MSIHKTQDGTWRVKYRQNGRQLSKTFPTKSLAERFDAEVKRRKVEGRPINRRQDAPTVEEFTIQWLAGRDDLSAKTLIGYATAIEKHVTPHIGHLRVHGSELRPAVLAAWQRERLDDGAGPASLRVAQMVLSQIFDAAILPHELLESNPLAPVKPPKLKRKAHRYLTAVEVERLRRTLINDKDTGSATLVSVLAYVGIRPQDALALEWKHVKTDLAVVQKNLDGVIVPGSKTGDSHKRRVNLPEPVAADLESWRIEQGKPSHGLIFPRSKDGKAWRDHDYQRWRKTYKAAAKTTKLGSLKPYDLRHTCASLLAAAGWNHLEIARQLGHAPETSVRVYQHLLDIGQDKRPSIDQWITEARAEVAAAPEPVDVPE